MPAMYVWPSAHALDPLGFAADTSLSSFGKYVSPHDRRAGRHRGDTQIDLLGCAAEKFCPGQTDFSEREYQQWMSDSVSYERRRRLIFNKEK